MKLKLFTFLVAVVTLQSCGSSQVEQNAKLREEVIAIHDEVMPKMGQLKSFQKTALEKAEELSARDTVDSIQVNALRDLAGELDGAYEGMFVWMRQYDVEDGELSPEEVKVYLDEQKLLVTKVNKDMKSALAKADSLLKIQ